MGKHYQVVISTNQDFFLSSAEIISLAELNQPWAIQAIQKIEAADAIFIPSQEELPRHDRSLIELAKSISRFQIINLEVKIWPPKYAILGKSSLGEELIEPCTVPWKTVYYPEEYSLGDGNPADEQDRKIRAIAP